MKIRFSDRDIATLKRLLDKIERGDCCAHAVKDSDSGLIFVAQDTNEQLEETRLIKAVLYLLISTKERFLHEKRNKKQEINFVDVANALDKCKD